MADPSRLSVVIVNYRTPLLVARCLHSLATEREAFSAFDVVVVDGGSADSSLEIMRAELAAMGDPAWIELIPLDINGGFGWGNNQALLRLLTRQEINGVHTDAIRTLRRSGFVRHGRSNIK